MLQEEAEREPAEESKVNISLSDYPIQMSKHFILIFTIIFYDLF